MLTIPQISCIGNFKVAMRKYFKLDGRARRSEFWFFKLIIYFMNAIFLFLAQICIAISNNKSGVKDFEEIDVFDSTPVVVIYIIINAIFLIPNITVSVRRLHDVGKSGWYYFLNLIPIIGTLILLYFYLQDSTPGDNEYGATTKYILQENDFSRRNPLVNNSQNEMQEFP